MKLNPKLVKEMLNLQYPIGKTELFFDDNDHSNYMGFTWQLEAKGKTIVGIDTNDTDFDTIGKTGGSKYLQDHWHGYQYGSTPGGNGTGIVYSGTEGTNNQLYAIRKVQGVTTGDSGNLQPYEVFAIWVRTA